jgi:NAD(P)-dependent dehydrogenase (short-subunit alcohol dehydrogenase family)
VDTTPLAGSAPARGRSQAAWERALRANLEGAAATVRAAWPALRVSGQGRIVLVSTGVTRHGMAGVSAYAAAKAGLEGLAATLKWEGREAGILINVVAPGFTVTERNLARFGDEVRETVRERNAVGSPFDAGGHRLGGRLSRQPSQRQHHRRVSSRRRRHRLRPGGTRGRPGLCHPPA